VIGLKSAGKHRRFIEAIQRDRAICAAAASGELSGKRLDFGIPTTPRTPVEPKIILEFL
jgi:hypothetical protein